MKPSGKQIKHAQMMGPRLRLDVVPDPKDHNIWRYHKGRALLKDQYVFKGWREVGFVQIKREPTVQHNMFGEPEQVSRPDMYCAFVETADGIRISGNERKKPEDAKRDALDFNTSFNMALWYGVATEADIEKTETRSPQPQRDLNRRPGAFYQVPSEDGHDSQKNC